MRVQSCWWSGAKAAWVTKGTLASRNGRSAGPALHWGLQDRAEPGIAPNPASDLGRMRMAARRWSSAARRRSGSCWRRSWPPNEEGQWQQSGAVVAAATLQLCRRNVAPACIDRQPAGRPVQRRPPHATAVGARGRLPRLGVLPMIDLSLPSLYTFDEWHGLCNAEDMRGQVGVDWPNWTGGH